MQLTFEYESNSLNQVKNTIILKHYHWYQEQVWHTTDQCSKIVKLFGLSSYIRRLSWKCVMFNIWLDSKYCIEDTFSQSVSLLSQLHTSHMQWCASLNWITGKLFVKICNGTDGGVAWGIRGKWQILHMTNPNVVMVLSRMSNE